MRIIINTKDLAVTVPTGPCYGCDSEVCVCDRG